MKTWEIDFEFLLNQMKHPQIGSMDSLDTDLTKRKKLQNVRVMERQKSEVQEKEEQEERNRSATADEINERLGNDDNVVITMTADSEDDYVPTRSLRKPKKADKLMLELPTKDLTKDTTALCALLKPSHTAVTSIYTKIVMSGGGELKDSVMSKASTWRNRIKDEKEVERKMKLEVKELSAKHPYTTMHSDGKKVTFASGEVQERLVICLQQVGLEDQPRFLGAPQTPDGTGAAQCEAQALTPDVTLLLQFYSINP